MGDILFISSTRIGDAVLSSGALAHAQKLLPDAGVVIACGGLPEPLFRATPNLKAIHVVDRRTSGGHWLSLWQALRGQRYELAIDLRGSLITYGLAAKRRIRHVKTPEVRHKVEEISALMGDFAKGIKAFRKGLQDDDKKLDDRAGGAVDVTPTKEAEKTGAGH